MESKWRIHHQKMRVEEREGKKRRNVRNNFKFKENKNNINQSINNIQKIKQKQFFSIKNISFHFIFFI